MSKPRRCPRCRNIPSVYVEMWSGHTIEFYADAYGCPEGEGYLREGEPSHVEARCRCGYRWRLRGVTQITELRGGEA